MIDWVRQSRLLQFGLAAAWVVLIAGCPPGDRKPSGDRGDQKSGSGAGGSTGGQRGTRTTSQPPKSEPEPPAPPLASVWPPKAIWVARASYRSPQEIVQVMDNCQRAGFNTVLFQVRGAGTVYYPSRIEPWGGDYATQPPNFDPLAVACREAHRRGMALHAWINVMPGWSGDALPSDPRQLYNARPGWFWYDQNGQRQPLDKVDKFYVSVNPCLPEVRQYLVNVAHEIIANYPVDGLHLDYIRFPMDKAKKGIDYPRDSRTLALYREATGKVPQKDSASWSRWRTDQVTCLVKEIRAMQKKVKPHVILSAACGPDLDEFRQRYFQDGASWLRNGWVDAVFVMNYHTNTATFRKRQEAWQKAAGNRMVVAGIGEYIHKTTQTTIDQLKWARSWGRGFAVFSYVSMFEQGKESRIAAIRSIIAAK